jgi:hypothetical protein
MQGQAEVLTREGLYRALEGVHHIRHVNIVTPYRVDGAFEPVCDESRNMTKDVEDLRDSFHILFDRLQEYRSITSIHTSS